MKSKLIRNYAVRYLHKLLTDSVENSGYYYHIIQMQQGTFEAGMTAISKRLESY